MTKMLVFDMDGTLLSTKHQINETSLAAIRTAKDAGYLIVFCSGRPYFDMQQYQTQYQIADYMVCNNGTYWVDIKPNVFHFDKTISPEIAKKAIAEGQKYCALLALHTDEATYRARLCPEKIMPDWYHEALIEEKAMFLDRYNFPSEQIFDKIQNSQVLQVAFRLDHLGAQKLSQDLAKTLHNQVDIFVANLTYVDVNPQGINKFTGLVNLTQFLKMSTNDIIAFGDSNNDLEMLKNVGYGICLANGTTQAKAAAQEVIGNNDSDAIAQKIYELLT